MEAGGWDSTGGELTLLFGKGTIVRARRMEKKGTRTVHVINRDD